MKTLSRIIFFTIIFISDLSAQTPQWEFLGLNNEQIFDIVIDDSSNIYLASDEGVFKSTDNGITWIFNNNG
ncbi:MAG: hypothetical protein Q7S39_01445, partial [Ignavibacteria bacterium]|nr:hypothetical protein [Ignavibacteria bacterium]